MLYAILALLVIIGDQVMKFWVASNITSGAMELIPGFVSLVNVHNTGAAFSFLAGANAKLIFIAIAIAVTILVIIALATNLVSGKLGRISLVFIMAGGLANCIDRILYGYVQDMFRLDFINFAVFNVADIFITVFAILFILYVLFGTRKSKSDDDDYEDEDEYDDDEEDEDEDDDDEDDEEEDERPAKRHFMRKRVEYDDDDEEEDDEPEQPVFRKQKEEKKPSRKERRAKYEDEYEEYKRKKALRDAQAQETEQPAPVVVNPDAPFAEWENKTEEKPAEVPAEKPVVKPAAKPAADIQPTRTVPAVNVRKPVEAADATKSTPAVKPAAPKAPAAPAVKPEPVKPAPKKADDDDDLNFSLEDILNEYRK